MNGSVLSCRSLRKKFARTVVIRDIEIAIREAEIFALIGLNGAGKTTLLKCLLGLISPSAGEIFFKGHPLAAEDIRRSFSYLPEAFQFPREFTGKELISFFAGLSGRPAISIDEIFSLVGLAEHADKKLKAYSRGMLQRLGLGVTLCKDPQVVILDEPFLGLDVVGQQKVLEIIRWLKEKGKTVIISSNILHHLDGVADAVGILHAGLLRSFASVDELKSVYSSATIEEAFLKHIRAL